MDEVLYDPPDHEAHSGQPTTLAADICPDCGNPLAFFFDGEAASRGDPAPPGLRLEMPRLDQVDPAVRAAVEGVLLQYAAEVGVGLDPAVDETTPTAPPASPWEMPDLPMAGSVRVTLLGGVSLVGEECEGYEFDSYDGVFRKVEKGEKFTRGDILEAYGELLLAQRGIPEEEREALVLRLGERLTDTWGRRGPTNNKVCAAAMYEVNQAARKGTTELQGFALDGHERALRTAAYWRLSRAKESCSYRPAAMVRRYRDSKTGRWTERWMPAPCRHESCPRCAAIKAREERERLRMLWLYDRQRGAAWWVKLVLTTAPAEDGCELAQAVKLSRKFERVTAALRRWFGKDVQVWVKEEYRPRYHLNVLVRGVGVMPGLLQAAIETGSLPQGATGADLLALAQADLKRRDGHDRPLFHRRIRPVVKKLQALVTRLGWGKEVCIRPVLLAPGEEWPEADIKELTKPDQRVGMLIPVGSRTTRATTGWWAPQLRGQDWKRKAKAVHEEDDLIAAGKAPYAQPWEEPAAGPEAGEAGGAVGVVSSTAGSSPTPTSTSVSAGAPPAVRAEETARRTAEFKREFPRSHQGCPGRRKTDVLQDSFSVRDCRAWRETQTARTGVQYGAVVTNAARLLSTWAELRVLDSSRAQLQRAVEVGWHLTCWAPEWARREEMRAWVRQLEQFAQTQPGLPPPAAGPEAAGTETVVVQ